MERRYRVVVAEAGTDEGGLGVRPLARALRDTGFEVVSLGSVDEPAQVIQAALQEDADAIGVGCFAGSDPDLVGDLEVARNSAALSAVSCFVLADGPTDSSINIRVFALDASVAEVADWLQHQLGVAPEG